MSLAGLVLAAGTAAIVVALAAGVAYAMWNDK